MSDEFPIDRFRQAFIYTQKIKSSLQPFLSEMKKQNIQWSHLALEELYRLMVQPNIEITLKFNSIFGIKFLFDIAEIPVMNMIQIYFTDKLLEIASYDCKVEDNKRGANYFITQGYANSTPEIDKYGFNYVKMASQLLQAASFIKPKRLFSNKQTSEPSAFENAFLKLKERGYKPLQTLSYYKAGVAEQIRTAYLNNLKTFEKNSQNYIDYFADITEKYIDTGKKYQGRLHPYKIFEDGDVVITKEILTVCLDTFQNITDIKILHRALELINNFFKWGDIEAFYQINNRGMLDSILKEITVENSDKSIKRSRKLFNKYKGSQEQKQNFYIEVLKGIQFWAVCFPKALKAKDKDSYIKHIHDQLRLKFKLEFPEDKDLVKSKNMCDESIKKKKLRNMEILKQLSYEDPELKSIFIKSQKMIKQERPHLHQNTPANNDYDSLKKQMIEVSRSLETFADNQANSNQKLKKIIAFRENFEKKMQTAELSNDQFEQIYNQGNSLLSKIEEKASIIKKYEQKQISFSEFSEQMRSKPIPPPHQKQPSSVIESQIKEQPIKMQKQFKVLHKQQKNKDHIKIQTPIKQFESNQNFSDSKQISSLNEISKITSNQLKLSKNNQTIIEQVEQLSKINTVEKNIIGSLQKIKIQNSEHRNQISHKQQKILEGSKKVVHSIKKIEKPSENIQIKIIKNDNEHQQADSAIVEDEENSIQIKPKAFNIAGSYRTKGGLSNNDEIKEDNKVNGSSSRKLQNSRNYEKSEKSKVNFSERSFQKVEQVDSLSKYIKNNEDDDMIGLPASNPLEQSFHDLGNFQEQISRNKNNLSFKKVFEADKYLLKANKNQSMYWLRNDTANLIKPIQGRAKSRPKDSSINVPQILNEKNRQFQKELKFIEYEKDRKIKELEKKVYLLESEGINMKQQINQKQKEIQIMKQQSEIEFSRTKKYNLIEDQEYLFKNKVASAQKSVHNRSFYDDIKQKQPKLLDPLGKLIQSKAYRTYFDTFASQKERRGLLKNKQLIYKDEKIQFGCMSRRQGSSLIITFYITPQMDLQSLTYRIANSDSLIVESEPKNFPVIRQKKQQKLYLTININTIPFSLPTIEFYYNIDNKLDTKQFNIPCAFHKFIHIDTVDQKIINQAFSDATQVIRGQEIPYSKKLLKSLDSLKDYFPNLSPLRNGGLNGAGQIIYAGEAKYQQSKFLMRLAIKPNQFLYVQAIQGLLKDQKIIEFYLSLISTLLIKDVDLLD